MNIGNASEAERGPQPNWTEWQESTSSAESQTAVLLWRAWSPCLVLLGTFGNVATLLVMRRVSQDSSSSQHVFLMALALSDLSLLYTGLFQKWLRDSLQVDLRLVHVVVCKVQKWCLYSFNTTSAWLVTCVTVQRTLAVLWPHRMRGMCTVRRAWVAVLVVVLAAFLTHFHLVLGVEISHKGRCDYIPGVYGFFFMRVYTWLDMSLSSLLPSVCLLVCDVVLSRTLFRAGWSTSSLSTPALAKADTPRTAHVDTRRRKTASKTTAMILAVSFTFLALTLPASVFIIWCNLGCDAFAQTASGPGVIQLLMAVTFLLWYSNSAVNFVLYCITGTKFRAVFLSCLFPCWPAAADAAAAASSASNVAKDGF